MEPLDQLPILPAPENLPEIPPKPVRFPIYILLLILILIISFGSIFALNRLRSSSQKTIPLPTLIPTIIITPTPIIPVITSIPTPTTSSSPKSTNTPRPKPSPTTIVTSGKLNVNLRVLYTQENIEDYKVIIYKENDPVPLITTTSKGNTYNADNLSAGNYKINFQTGRNNNYCGSSGNGIDSATVPFEIKAGLTTTLTADIYPYPGFIYLKTKSGYPMVNATINTGSYSATTDVLGRVVLYSINPGPYNLNISYQGNNFNHQISSTDCMWLQTVSSPLATTPSTVSVTINPTVDYLSLTPELIVKEVPLDIKPNALGNRLVYDTVRKYSLEESRCSGLGASYFKFGGMISLYQNGSPGQENTGNTVNIPQVDPGNYDVCVYESGKPGVYWPSSLSSITVSMGTPSSTTIDFPKK